MNLVDESRRKNQRLPTKEREGEKERARANKCGGLALNMGF